jgi:chaperonin GroEL (HSP60 family)
MRKSIAVDVDTDEVELAKSLEEEEWESDLAEGEKIQYEEYARASLATQKRIHIQVTERDLLKIQAKAVEEVKIGDDKLLYVRECKNPKAVTVVIRGGSEHVVDEAERSLHDALCVVRNAVEDGKIVAGGGAPEAEMARQLRNYAVKVGGREQLAIEAYAEAVETIPMMLAENSGLDPIDIMVSLRAEHEHNQSAYYGVDVFTGKIKNMLDLNVVEPLRVKQQVIKSATEAANMILKIDDLIAAKGMDKEPKPPKTPEPSYDY